MNMLPVNKEGKDYVPFTKTNTFSSKGRATRIMGIKSGRIHHLQSDNQYRAFLYFEWSDRVIDIRESYPLIDIMETIDTKDDLRFDKFSDKEKQKQFVITTNFLLTIDNGGGDIAYVARTIKNTTELSRAITGERLEIERRYWQAKGIEWMIITEKELDRHYVKNIEFVREAILPSQYQEAQLQEYSNKLALLLINNADKTIRRVFSEFERILKLDEGVGLFVWRYLIAKKKVKVDMKKKIDISKSVKEIVI